LPKKLFTKLDLILLEYYAKTQHATETIIGQERKALAEPWNILLDNLLM